jgi:N-acetylglutamate synthase-like GNAT family acetyltransferase
MAMLLEVRDANQEDNAAVVALVQDLAHWSGEQSPISPAYVEQYLAHPGSYLLMAEQEGEIVGLLSYSIRPSLYHAGDCCLIEELVVRQDARGAGVGSALVQGTLQRAVEKGWIEVAVSTMPDNQSPHFLPEPGLHRRGSVVGATYRVAGRS